MSAESGSVTDRHFAYIREHTTGEDALLRDLKVAAEQAGIPRIWISPEQGSFMQILMRVHRARDVVEVGTLAGYSAIWMARGLPTGGTLRTFEFEPDRAAFAREWIHKAQVAPDVEVVVGDARERLREVPDDSADACFIDADKEGYATYLDECVRILRPGGLVLADNAFGFGRLFEPDEGEDSVQAIRAFNDLVAERADIQGIIVPFGDGVWVGTVLEGAS